MRKLILTYLLLTFLVPLYTQETAPLFQGAAENIAPAAAPVQAVPSGEGNLQLAISNRNYPVTPGDVYTLTFILAGETVSNVLLVESDYTINLAIFGKIDASGMTFSRLKPLIEQTIASGYPRSLPSVTITAVGVFQIPVTGEIPYSRYVTAWGLSRLSEVLEGTLGDYSSIRDIEIISENGFSRKYDLLKALNLGILEENPYVRPGDTIIISRVNREITILGEVYKPGNYQLLDTEGLKEVYAFTGGYTPVANTSRIRIDRFSEGHPISFTLDPGLMEKNFKFQNGDVVTVPTIMSKQPVVYIEGGVDLTPESAVRNYPAEDLMNQNPDTTEYNRIVRQINTGETLYDVLYSLKDSISPFADLEHGYLLRENEAAPIPVNMQELLYEYLKDDDITLQPFDHISIPLKRPLVFVTGAANNPGRFSYIPQEDYSYYLNLAGGYDTDRNKNGKVIITDRNGKRKDSIDPIHAGDTIDVLSNNFLYNFNMYFPAITAGLTLVTTIITLTSLLNQTNAP